MYLDIGSNLILFNLFGFGKCKTLRAVLDDSVFTDLTGNNIRAIPLIQFWYRKQANKSNLNLEKFMYIRNIVKVSIHTSTPFNDNKLFLWWLLIIFFSEFLFLCIKWPPILLIFTDEIKPILQQQGCHNLFIIYT